MVRVIRDKLAEEIVFSITAACAVISMFFGGIHPEAVDWHVIAALFMLMLISLGLERHGFLDFVSISILNRYRTRRSIGLVLLAVTGMLGMLVTNDVALLTIVPLTLILARQARFTPTLLIVLETAAANIGASLSPFGSPQNLFLFSLYRMSPFEFLSVMAPFAIIGFLLLVLMNLRHHAEPIQIHLEAAPIRNPRIVGIQLLLFALTLLGILRVINLFWMLPIVGGFFLLFDRRLFVKVDWFLLATFLFFFLLISNLTQLSILHAWSARWLDAPHKVLLAGALLSQGISNVPAAILLSGFTTSAHALLVGVNVGGLGTMIASLANLISWRLYAREHASRPYVATFTRINVLLLLALGAWSLLTLH